MYGFRFFLTVVHISYIRFLGLDVYDNLCDLMFEYGYLIFGKIVAWVVLVIFFLTLAAIFVFYCTHTFYDMIVTLISCC